MRHEMYKIAAVLFIFSLPIYTNAQTKDVNVAARYAQANLINDFIECASFYAIISQGEIPLARREKYENLASRIISVSVVLAESIDMKKEAVISKLQLHNKKMGESIGFDGINISILQNKYDDFCKILMEDPEKRLEYWVIELVSKEGS